MKKIEVKQHDISDCGAACLSSVVRFFGLNESISRIRQYAGTGKKGTNLKGMIEAAGKLGMNTRAVKVEESLLESIPVPAIAHLKIKNVWYHFVVIYSFSRNHVKIMDPATGKLELRRISEFRKEWTGVLLLLSPSERFSPGQRVSSTYQRLWALVAPHRNVLMHALLGACVYSILGISTSIYVENLIDVVIPSGNSELLNQFSLLLILIIIARIYIGYVKNILIIKSGIKIDASLIIGYFRHLMKLPFRFFRSMRTGEIISRINDAMKIRSFINNMALELSVDSMILGITILFMLNYSMKLAILILLAIPVYILIYVLYNRFNRVFLRKAMEYSADLESGFVESVRAHCIIQTSPTPDYFNIRMEERCLKLLRTGYSIGRNSNLAYHSTDLLSNLMVIGILWSGSGLIFKNQLTTGELLSFFTLFSYIAKPLNTLIHANRWIQDAFIAADRLFQVLDLECDEENTELIGIPDSMGKFDIRISNLTFNYPGQADLFKELNLDLRAGEITAIIGENGSGKSTLLHLIQKLETTTKGNIWYKDLDLRYLRREDLNKITGYIPQSSILITGTFLENIALGSLEPDPARVKQVCEFAGLGNLVSNLTHGFATMISEDGNNFSGGEKQKIAIARGLYHDPDILLLDEPTASMDKKSVQKIMDILTESASKGKLILMVTHNIHIAARADRVVLLKEGKAEITGNHKHLWDNNLTYRKFWAENKEG